ncbi:protamine-like [Ceratina calcarata]|uniref:Protamine-like n=1 Tax=Ceratina calcarata TaxID=156304 RepID=A0AAJ7S4W0_9HYME|nr:protamine-like [Ceratina calcarata]
MGNTGSAQSKTQKRRLSDNVGGHIGRNGKVVRAPGRRGLNGQELIKFRATNPFIIFYLRLRSKRPKDHVTVIARTAGKLWSQMTSEQRKKYIDLANAEKRRREEQKRKRKSRRKNRRRL